MYLKPLETIDYVINEADETGGTVANFIINYYKKPNLTPLFQTVIKSGLTIHFLLPQPECRLNNPSYITH